MSTPGKEDTYDVCIVGAGIAGLNAALILGRCLRRVVVFDSGKPRNSASRGLHGFISRDGVHPLHLRDLGRAELKPYTNVVVHEDEVVAAHRYPEGFELRPRRDEAVHARTLLLATGRVDVLPEKPGFRELYGRGVHHCPICDGWEVRDQPLVAYARGTEAIDLALSLRTWSERVTVCSDGPAGLDSEQRARLERNDVHLNEAAVEAVVDDGHGEVGAVRFADGATLACRGVFFDSECPQRSPLAENLGCSLDATGAVACQGPAATGVPGLFVAGNVRCGIHLAITAAAEGAEAAIAINRLLRERGLR